MLLIHYVADTLLRLIQYGADTLLPLLPHCHQDGIAMDTYLLLLIHPFLFLRYIVAADTALLLFYHASVALLLLTHHCCLLIANSFWRILARRGLK